MVKEDMSEFSRDLDSTSTKLMSYKLESTEKLADAVKIQALALEFDKVLDNIEKVVQYERSKVKVATQGKSRLPAALSQRECCPYSSANGEGRKLGNKRSNASTQETDDTDTDKDTCASASDAPEIHDDNEVDCRCAAVPRWRAARATAHEHDCASVRAQSSRTAGRCRGRRGDVLVGRLAFRESFLRRNCSLA